MSVLEFHPACVMAEDQYLLLIMGTGPHNSMFFFSFFRSSWTRTTSGSARKYTIACRHLMRRFGGIVMTRRAARRYPGDDRRRLIRYHPCHMHFRCRTYTIGFCTL